jgi:hypothetical protein
LRALLELVGLRVVLERIGEIHAVVVTGRNRPAACSWSPARPGRTAARRTPDRRGWSGRSPCLRTRRSARWRRRGRCRRSGGPPSRYNALPKATDDSPTAASTAPPRRQRRTRRR